ncbi:hypothetical protein EV424DRAFT_1416676 [Suillus variegatus]|nr:hypothetical protein EV424DRAFT_1416676 [Suillus variegatus]
MKKVRGRRHTNQLWVLSEMILPIHAIMFPLAASFCVSCYKSVCSRYYYNPPLCLARRYSQPRTLTHLMRKTSTNMPVVECCHEIGSRSTRMQALARTARGEVLRVDAGKANIGSACTRPWMRRLMWTVCAVGRLAP